MAKTVIDVVDFKGRGYKIANSWWGRAWLANLELYSDYENRLPRARSYLRGGKVRKLTVDKGQVTARVQGSRRTPYKVYVDLAPLGAVRYAELQAYLGERIDSLESLLEGNFPEDLGHELIYGDFGLFPGPREIDFGCSCPDWAYLCKHVGAVLYAIGMLFDVDPMLFFELRDVEVSGLIQDSIDIRLQNYLTLAQQIKPQDPLVLSEDAAKKLFEL